tara:strand:- start:2347 stop:3273 length:927 start_codon:yes stop_codon:yes gene_type:complete
MIVLGVSQHTEIEGVAKLIVNRPAFTHIQIRNLNYWSSDQVVEAIKIFNDLGKIVWVELVLGRDFKWERNLYGISPKVFCGNLTNQFDILNNSHMPDHTQHHLNIISKHLDNIDRVTTGWSSCGESGAYFRWIMRQSYKDILIDGLKRSIQPTILEFEKLWKMFAPIQSKLMMAAIDVPFEREAYLYQDNLENAPLLNWLKSHGIPNLIYRGCWLLDKSLREHKRNYQVVPEAVSPIIAHQKYYDSGKYPYKYYTDYLKAGAEFWTGIGFYKGIERGNAITLPELGYTGTFFMYSTQTVDAWKHYENN